MPQNEQAIANLKKQIERFNTFEKNTLINRSEWGSISLTDAKSDIDRIFSVIDHLKILPIEQLSIDPVNKITSSINAVNDLFDRINQFSVESSNPANQKDEFVKDIQQHADAIYNIASPWIPFLAYQQGDVSKNIENLTSSVSEAQSMVNNAKENLENKENEISAIIEKAREASAAAGAAVFTQDFMKESESKKISARKWLITTSIFAFITFLVAVILWFYPGADLDQIQIWQKLTSKIVFLGTLISSTIWCGRIYKALMHQSTVNRHQALSIQTIQAFSNAANDVQIKDAIVLEAARAVFGNFNTGYINEKNDTGEGDIRIIEVAKSIIPYGKG